MKKLISAGLVSIASMFAFSTQASTNDNVGSVRTEFRMIGSNSTIEVDRMVDDDIDGITCHVSYSKVGGVMGSIGLAEESSNFSISCRQTGPIVAKKNIKEQTKIKSFARNIFFKEMKVVRMYDDQTNTVIYLVYSAKLIDGSPFNAITSVPLMPWGTIEPILK